MEQSIQNVLVLLLGGFVGYCTFYFSQKGKNLATKEDIGEITHKIEEAKLLYARQLEQFKAMHQLKMAALDKRLQVHQDAFSLWAKMNQTSDRKEFKQLHTECSNWWDNNCLYLDPNVRSEFLSSITAMNQHHLFVQNGINHQWSFSDSEKLFNAISEATQLPPLTLTELTNIIKKPPEENNGQSE